MALNKNFKNDRAAVRDAVMKTKDLAGITGTWSFDPNGDTSLTIMSGSIVNNGKWELVTTLKPE